MRDRREELAFVAGDYLYAVDSGARRMTLEEYLELVQAFASMGQSFDKYEEIELIPIGDDDYDANDVLRWMDSNT